MAEDPRGGSGIPPRDQLAARPHYPPPSGGVDERMAGYHLPPPPAGQSVTLPSIQDGPPPSYGTGRGYPPPADPRASGHYSASPTNANGYPAPQGSMPQPGPYPYHPDQRPYSDYYAAQQRGAAYPHPDPYAQYPGYAQQPGPGYGQYPGDYARAGGQPQQPPQQAAPRQRTSIACRYCRKRKIRCSGYQNTTNGKCMNCDKLKIDCVFQPVSSNSSTAFIPVSAVPGGVPLGTRLYGAYGQPLPPQVAGSSPAPAMYGPPDSEYQHPMASPASQYAPPGHADDRAEPGRRRPRGPDDEPGMRLPPPNPYAADEDPRRRSPASGRSTNTPPTAYHHQYQQPGGYEADRTPTPRSNSSGHPPPAPASGGGSSNIMSLGHLVDQGPPPQRHGDSGRDIDQNMLGKLNRRS